MDSGKEHCFYFTRHGQSLWNVENKICGATDIPLTDYGRKQAEQTGQRILDEGIHIDEILYSPLVRAAETALIISKVTGIPAREEPLLKEQDFGIYEATPRHGEDFERAKLNFIYRFGTGESMLKLCHRIYTLLDRIRDDAGGRVYLLTAHNGISRAVESYFRDMTNEEFAAFGIRNCELRKYVFRKA